MTPRQFARALLATAILLPALGTTAHPAAPSAVESSSGMVVTAQHLASEVGAAVLRDGGNAIDAAVAVGYALAVTHPCCGNLGGGGFMLVHLASGRDSFINFREKAPQAATADMYLDAGGKPIVAKSVDGYLATGVPGTVMGLETAREEYGTRSRAALIAPAIALAEHGFVLSRGDVDVLAGATDAFRSQPNVAAVFLNHGLPFQPGDRLVQSRLAGTLRAISDGGAPAFYRGAIARAVASASQAHGGLLTLQDFAAYTVTESPPLSCPYRGFTVLSAPPPSSGGVTLCEMLRILEGFPLRSMGFHSSQEVHYLVEAMRFGYRDRNRYLGDPAFVRNPLARLMSEKHAAEIRARIPARRAVASASLGTDTAPDEHAETTHYSIVDRAGNAVAVTYTINDDFGAKVIAEDTGFFLNDEMDDFTAKPGAPNMFGLIQGEANAIAPRIHHQWLPDTLGAEPFALSADTTLALTKMGYHMAPLEVWGAGNAAQLVGIAPADEATFKNLGFPRRGLFYGASDSRAPAGASVAP